MKRNARPNNNQLITYYLPVCYLPEIPQYPVNTTYNIYCVLYMIHLHYCNTSQSWWKVAKIYLFVKIFCYLTAWQTIISSINYLSFFLSMHPGVFLCVCVSYLLSLFITIHAKTSLVGSVHVQRKDKFLLVKQCSLWLHLKSNYLLSSESL